MRRIIRRCVIACVCTIAAAPAFAQQPSPAGRIKVASGEAVIVRAGGTVPALSGGVVLRLRRPAHRRRRPGRRHAHRRHAVSTRPAQRSAPRLVRVRAGTGPARVVLKFVRGTAAYVSGRIAKLAPDAVRLETPAAIVGVRGTTLAVRVTPDDPDARLSPDCWPRAPRSWRGVRAQARAGAHRPGPPTWSCCCLTRARPARGRAIVSNADGRVELADGRAAADRQGRARPAHHVSEADVQRVFGDALAACRPRRSTSCCSFRFGSEELTDESRGAGAGGAAGEAGPQVPDVAVVGHTDTTGTAVSNFGLGLRRANGGPRPPGRCRAGLPLVEVISHGEAELLVRTADDVFEPESPRRNHRPMTVGRGGSCCCAAWSRRSSSRCLSLYRPPSLANLEYDVYDMLVRAAEPRTAQRTRRDRGRRRAEPVGDRPMAVAPRRRSASLIARLRDLGAVGRRRSTSSSPSPTGCDGADVRPDAALADDAARGRRRARLRDDVRRRAQPSGTCVPASARPADRPTRRREPRRPVLSRHRRRVQPAAPHSGGGRLGLPERRARPRRHPPARPVLLEFDGQRLPQPGARRRGLGCARRSDVALRAGQQQRVVARRSASMRRAARRQGQPARALSAARSARFPIVSAADVMQRRVPAGRLQGQDRVRRHDGARTREVVATPLDTLFAGVEVQATVADNLLQQGLHPPA